MEALPSSEEHRQRSMIGLIGTGVILVLLGLFVWRVLYYAQGIASGEIDPSTFDFTANFTTSAVLANSSIPDGEHDVLSSDDPSLGTPGAIVEIVEFADFGCPWSEDSSSVMREAALKYPDKIHYVYRDFPIDELHPIAHAAAEAAECAHDQGKFWEYHDKLYQNQARLDEDDFVRFAQELNLHMGQFESCVVSRRHQDEVINDYRDGVEAGVRGTPTFFINGNRIPGSIPADVLDLIIESIEE